MAKTNTYSSPVVQSLGSNKVSTGASYTPQDSPVVYTDVVVATEVAAAVVLAAALALVVIPD